MEINDAFHAVGTSFSAAGTGRATVWSFAPGVDLGVAPGGKPLSPKNVNLGTCGNPCSRNVSIKVKMRTAERN